MAQPTPYDRQFNFQDFQAQQPTSPLPGDEVDGELNAVKLTSDQTLANLAKIQRDDGALKNGIVTQDALSDSLSIGFTFRGSWLTATNYLISDGVSVGSIFYKAKSSHLSSALNQPPNATFWDPIANFTPLAIGVDSVFTAAIQNNAVTTAKIPDGAVTTAKIPDANVTTAKIADNAITVEKIVDAELKAIGGLTSAADQVPYFTGSGTAALGAFTTAGRALAGAADVAAQRTTLGLAMVVIGSQTISNQATLDFQSFGTTYRKIILDISDLLPVSASDLLLRLEQGGSFISSADYRYRASVDASDSTTYAAIASAGASSFSLSGTLGTVTGNEVSGWISISRPGSTAASRLISWEIGYNASGVYRTIRGGGSLLLGAAVTGARLLTTSGNLASGTVKAYGVL